DFDVAAEKFLDVEVIHDIDIFLFPDASVFENSGVHSGVQNYFYENLEKIAENSDEIAEFLTNVKIFKNRTEDLMKIIRIYYKYKNIIMIILIIIKKRFNEKK